MTIAESTGTNVQAEPETLNSGPSDPSRFPPLLPPGQLTLMLGEPGTGKSLVAIDLATRMSNNALHPPGPPAAREPLAVEQVPESADPSDFTNASVIICSLEDTYDTLKYRLTVAGANRCFVDLPPRLSLAPTEILPARKASYKKLARPAEMAPSPLLVYLCNKFRELANPRLLVLDPLPAFLGNVDASYNTSAIRRLLRPLLDLAEFHNVAILGISHLAKSCKSSNPLHHALGSLVYPALARTIYMVMPEGHSKTRRLLIPVKNNLGPMEKGLAFEITGEGRIAWDEKAVVEHPLLNTFQEWGNLEESFAQSQLDFAVEFLRGALAKGPVGSKVLVKEAREAEISQRTLERARFVLGVRRFKAEMTGQWFARLPKVEDEVKRSD